MNKLFRTLAIVMILVLLATACGMVGCANKGQEDEPGYTIGIISDPQIVAASDVGDDDYASFQDFNAVGQKMLFVSEAILKTAVDRLIEAKVDVVLIPGDLTENGSKAGHEMVATQCARLEAAGIPTYVICGNHDINKSPKRYMSKEDALRQGLTIYEEFADGSCSVKVSGVTPDEFVRIFDQYGYNDAIALDTLDEPVQTVVEDRTFLEVGTMSYVQDLPGSDYRLIAIDAANYYEDENEDTYYVAYYGTGKNQKAAIKGTGYPVMTDRLLGWVEAQLAAAKEAGKTPIAMTHFPVNNQMGDVIGMLTDGIDNRINRADELLALFARYGVQYVFTGHMHTQHVATYCDEEYGVTVTDIETGCLTNYPLPMRYVTLRENKVSIRNEYLSRIKQEYLPAYLDNATIRAAVTTDLGRYALDPFIYDNLLTNFDLKINDGGRYALFYKIFDLLLDTDDVPDEALDALADYVYNDVYMAFLKMPLYTKDKGSALYCLEDICQKYGVALPKSEYKTVFQFAVGLIGKVYKYDYDSDGGPISYDSTEGTILRYTLYAALEVLHTGRLLPMLHDLNDAIPATLIGEDMVRKLYQEDTLDLCSDGFVYTVLSFAQPIVDQYINLDLSKPKTVVSSLKLAVTLGTTLLTVKYPDVYDKTTKSVWGVPLSELLKIELGEDGNPIVEIYMDNLLKDIVFGKIGQGLLN